MGIAFGSVHSCRADENQFIEHMKLLAFNVAGIVLFLWIAVPMWAPPELADIPGAGAGTAIVWVVYALPVFLACALVDAVFLVYALAVTFLRKSRPLALWHLAIAPAWAVALYVDASHHWLL